MARREPATPRMSFEDNADRPKILPAPQEPPLCKGDKVLVSRHGKKEGPFLIEELQPSGKYTLCYEDGTQALNGEEIDATLLDRA
ncbi:MAG: hypothetical protein GOMPHAMPRED_001732 [Gomphillus americanus]|uniref:Uncharacterized protein n=1 Tax=Gomphillus americanus TaxID=1940652 RepID=A0A8H3F4R0_9LECA|nr:MAG: hypothetical protein GOMPHAMPRED_001732 [Gomphillus americanus]